MMQAQTIQDGAARGACLIVEDSRIDQRMMQRVLRDAGVAMPVVVAESLAEARQVLMAGGVGFILLDNSLPDGYGANFLTELVATTRKEGIPVVLVTDWPSPFMFAKAKQAGVRAILEKSEFLPDRARDLVRPN